MKCSCILQNYILHFLFNPETTQHANLNPYHENLTDISGWLQKAGNSFFEVEKRNERLEANGFWFLMNCFKNKTLMKHLDKLEYLPVV